MIARFLCCIALILSACAAPMQTHYYQLADSAFRQPEHTATTLVRVELADVLKKQSLIYQDTAQTIHLANHHLWAENLAHSLAQVFANHLNEEKKAGYTIYPNPKPSQELHIIIHRFQGTYRAEVLIEGDIRFYNADGKLSKTHHFAVHQPQQGDGYPAMVAALDQALITAAKSINQSLQ